MYKLYSTPVYFYNNFFFSNIFKFYTQILVFCLFHNVAAKNRKKKKNQKKSELYQSGWEIGGSALMLGMEIGGVTSSRIKVGGEIAINDNKLRKIQDTEFQNKK